MDHYIKRKWRINDKKNKKQLQIYYDSITSLLSLILPNSINRLSPLPEYRRKLYFHTAIAGTLDAKQTEKCRPSVREK
jgi:hypothetical protein